MKKPGRIKLMGAAGLLAVFVMACTLSSAPMPVSAVPSTPVPAVPTAAPSLAPAAGTAPAGARQLTLTPEGASRQLPANILGASVEAMIEHLLDNPQKIAAIQRTAPGVIRFPGGSQSNYYNWQTGLLDFSPLPDSSPYYKFWAGVAPKIALAFPDGIHMEQYQSMATQIGADVILVPNLETSSLSLQVAWFTQMAAEHVLPKNIELGNEFYIAMAGDPNVMRIWPDEPTALAVMKQYEQALQPIVGAGAKFAVQSAGAAFTVPPDNPTKFQQRLLAWDQALAPADWFQAVSIHLYPDPAQMVQQAGNPGPDRQFQLFMGQADSGVDRALNDLAARLPGKEIWITEWSPRGGNFANTFGQPDLVPPQMNAQLVARETLAILRHPAVTRALYFTLNADSNSVFRMYVLDSAGNYQPMPATLVLQWFDRAANDNSTFQRLIDATSQPVSGLGEFSESYNPVEGGLFTSAGGTTLIIQNASAEARWYDPGTQNQGTAPASAELLIADVFTSTVHSPAQPQNLDPHGAILIPPFSIARMVWGNP
ncbi:MAG: hypothetical protein ABSA01_13200 [Anaerolineales bacterium]|jgi:hypothetical protein